MTIVNGVVAIKYHLMGKKKKSRWVEEFRRRERRGEGAKESLKMGISNVVPDLQKSIHLIQV